MGDQHKPLPAPRLQLRWEDGFAPSTSGFFAEGEPVWKCHYELVLPLSEHDIRREVYEDGEQVGEQAELVISIKGATLRGKSGSDPCCVDGGPPSYFDAPLRDGAHAQWDAKNLGGLPIFVIAVDGTPFAKALGQDAEGVS